MKDRLRAILSGCAEVFFVPGPTYGLILAAILLLNPRIAIAGAVAVTAAYVLARLVALENAFLQYGYYVYNPLLTGCALGYRFEINALLLLLTILAGMVTFVVTACLANLLTTRWWLPVLSLPFSLVSALMYFIVPRYAHLLTAATPSSVVQAWDLGFPLALAGFFKSWGAIVFAPSVVVGVLLCVLILSSSRILFILSVLGYYVGVGVRGLLLGSVESALYEYNNYNFILIAMALGGLFLIPSWRSVLISVVAVSLAPFVLDVFQTLWGTLGIPPFTLPFCVIILGAIYTLRLAQFPWLSTGIGRTPEETRESSLVFTARYPGETRTLFLPFTGKWTVWQGFNGRWTHQGIWRFAYDFVATGEDGHTHRGTGQNLQDFYCYRMPVLSPTRGRVVRVIDHLPDNPIGTVSGGSNWGNLVIIQDHRGYYVEISHFSPKSIRVQEGELIERGTLLGLCGNSGNSPQPHIHIQVQLVDSVGAATVPFSFVAYRTGDEYHANDLPREGAHIEPLTTDPQFDARTNFVLDDELTYDVFQAGCPIDHLRLQIKLAADATYYLESAHGKLYFGKYDGTFYVQRVEGDDPYLKLLFLSCPRLPLAFREGLVWYDYVPASLVLRGVRRWFSSLAAVFWPEFARIRVEQRFTDRHRLTATAAATALRFQQAATVELDEQVGWAAVTVGDLQFRRTSTPDTTPLSSARRVPTPSRWRQAALVASLIVCLGSSLVLGTVDRHIADERAHAAISQSIQQERKRDLTGAIATLNKEYATQSQHYVVNLRLAWLHYANNQYPTASWYYYTAEQIAPAAIEPRLGSILPLLAERKFAEAEDAAQFALKLDPHNYYAQLRLATALRGQRKYADALTLLQSLAARYPADSEVLSQVALLNESQAAVGGTTLTLAAPDNAASAALARAVQLEANRQYAEALAALRELPDASKAGYAVTLRTAWLYYLSGDYRHALEQYQQASEVAPQSIEAKLGRLYPLLASEQYAAAMALANDILESDPANYLANLDLAVAYRKSGNPRAAADVLAALRKLYPTDLTLLTDHALAAVAQNDKPLARELFYELLALDPDNVLALRQLSAL